MPPPPQVFYQKHQPYTLMQGIWRRCPTRKGPRCRGRGEAAGHFVFTGETFRTAAVNRTLAGFDFPRRTVVCRRRSLRPRLGSSEISIKEVARRRGTPTRKNPSTDYGNGSSVELLISVGAEGTGGNYYGLRVRKAGPPCHRMSDNVDHLALL